MLCISARARIFAVDTAFVAYRTFALCCVQSQQALTGGTLDPLLHGPHLENHASLKPRSMMLLMLLWVVGIDSVTIICGHHEASRDGSADIIAPQYH